MKKLAVLLLGAAALAACAGPQVKPSPGPAVELDSTPFFPQDDHQCGPAALATALTADGVQVTPGELTPLVYLPQRKGSLQTELVSATRHYQRVPYLLRDGFDQLAQQLRAGKPVLVLQNLGVSFWPAWHYAVVVGYDPDKDEVILRSGRTRREVLSTASFLRTWKLADQWALVAARPDAIPAGADAKTWVEAAAAFETTGQPQLAAQAYDAGLARWPQEPLLWFARANIHYAAHDLNGATDALRHAAQLAPEDAAVRNNLAQVLMERGCRVEADAQLKVALEHANPSQRAQIAQTQAQLLALPQTATAQCLD